MKQVNILEIGNLMTQLEIHWLFNIPEVNNRFTEQSTMAAQKNQLSQEKVFNSAS
jgi:hypothetical protein